MWATKTYLSLKPQPRETNRQPLSMPQQEEATLLVIWREIERFTLRSEYMILKIAFMPNEICSLIGRR